MLIRNRRSKSCKYRAYPDAITGARLDTALNTCRWLYNKLLEECTTARENGFTPTMREMQARIVTLKEENPFLKDVYSKVIQMVNYTLWSNIASLSQTKKKGRKIGKLRFKSASRYRTLNYNQSGFKIDREHSMISLSKIGTIPFTMHRPYPGVVKGVLVTRSGDKWYVIIQAEQDISEPKKEGRSVGIDVGLNSFAVDSDDVTGSRRYNRALPGNNGSRKIGRRRKGNWKRYMIISQTRRTIFCTNFPVGTLILMQRSASKT